MFLPARSSESQLASRLVSEQSPVISGDSGGDISGGDVGESSAPAFHRSYYKITCYIAKIIYT